MVAALWAAGSASPAAQDASRYFAGLLLGVSTLSADGGWAPGPAGPQVSLYSPTNGMAINAFGGIHLRNYFTLQANYMWNRNDLTLFSSSPASGSFYDQRRMSAQHAFVVDGLIYFRDRDSAVRPYLGTGLSVLRFSSPAPLDAAGGPPNGPPGQIGSTRLGVRSAVGVDLSLSRHLMFRYSFSETISGNPVSPHLAPPGERGLANYQNLFGMVCRF
jgi:hypothetical protein